ncbi:MAG: hypothetical protein N3D11_02650 [Candidatus Sumerlaeia bacterium]|nr:hypothetical protein [Candidatus Sumerlaeia bacterium]
MKRSGKQIQMSVIGLAGVFAAVVQGMLVPSANADYIVRKDGKRLQGLVREETPQLIRFETPDRIVLTFSRSEVERVEREESRENLALSAAIHLRRPDFIEASNLLRRALEMGLDVHRARQIILEVSPHFLDRMTYMSSTDRKQWLALCEELSRRGAPDSDWTYFRGDMALAMGEPAAAMTAWRSLDAAYFSSQPAKRTRVIQWALPRLIRAANEGQFEECVGMLELLHALDPARGKSCQVWLALGKASAARRRGNIGEACRLYAEEVVPLAPAIGRECLRTLLEPECDVLCERGHFNEALAFVRDYAKPHVPDLAARLMTKIYRQAIHHHLSNGHWEMARGLLAEGSAYFDEREREQLKQECYWGEQRSRVPADDAARHFQLGLELQKRKMNGAAVEEFILAARSSQLREMAEKQIALIREGEALALLEKIASLYGESRYVEVLDTADQFRSRHPKSPLTDRVDSLARLARTKLAEQSLTAEALALSRIDQARRLLLQGRPDEALEMVDSVLHEQFTTATVAAEPLVRARALKQEILKAQIAAGVGSGGGKSDASSAAATAGPFLPGLLPSAVEQLNEDAFKREIQEILKQLQL